jgi:hypothetical protein
LYLVFPFAKAIALAIAVNFFKVDAREGAKNAAAHRRTVKTFIKLGAEAQLLPVVEPSSTIKLLNSPALPTLPLLV